MQNVLKKDINLPPFKMSKAKFLTQVTKTNRLQAAKLPLENLSDCTQPPFFGTVEKSFIVQAAHINRNERIFAVN